MMDVDELKFSQESEPMIGGDLSDDLAALREKVKELQEHNDQLAATVTQLKAQIDLEQPEPINNTYTIEQFMLRLARYRGRTYGWCKDYAQATVDTPDCTKYDTDDIHRWQKENKVPVAAFVQIDRLVFKPRTGRRPKPNWTEDNITFLIGLVGENRSEKNAVLARQCSTHFGREISEDAIKGEKYRLEQAGRLPA